MSDGGKGSSPRPFSDRDQFEKNFEAIFGMSKLERKKREEALQRMVQESEKLGLYDDEFTKIPKRGIINHQQDFDVENPDPDKRSWYYDNHGIKRKKK